MNGRSAYEKEDLGRALTSIREEIKKEWLLDKLRARIGRAQDIYEYIELANRVYLFRKKEEDEEELSYDEEGRVNLKGIAELAKDKAAWSEEVAAGVDTLVGKHRKELEASGTATRMRVQAREYEQYAPSI